MEDIGESLLLAYIRGTISESDKIKVEQWIKENPQNEKTARQVARLYHAQRTKERTEKRNAAAAFKKQQQKQLQRKHRFYLRKALTAAAVIALLVSLAFNTFLYKKQPLPETQYITIQTNAGMRTNLNLPDGTLVHLNSASKLTYPIPYDTKERKVILEGEGYFDVTSNPDHPFIVSVADDRMRVKVLGTRFNVNAYPHGNEIYTTLVEGAITLQFTDYSATVTEQHLEDSSAEAVYDLLAKRVIINEQKLIPTEKATYNIPSGKVTIREVVTANEYAWKDGKLIFKDTPMPEVLNRLSNYYNVKFEIKDPVIESYPFTGTFDNKQLFQVLDYFKLISKINFTIHSSSEDDSNGTKHTVVILDK